MTEVTAKPQKRTRSAIAAIAISASLVAPGAADAGPYTVVSCDSAGLFGHSSAAWAPFANAGSTYASCPSGGGLFAGISDRLTGATYGGFSFSGHAFNAPPGTSITGITWAGRMARDNCSWGTYIRALPSDTAIIGTPHNQFCKTSGWDTRGWPMPYTVPNGTTRLEQLAFCGAAQCSPGAAMHSHNVEVTIEDPRAPSISLGGGLASGRWISGANGRPSVEIGAGDSAGIQRVEATIEVATFAESYACNYAVPAPCPGFVRPTAPLAIADLSDGPHVLRVAAFDPAGNSSVAQHQVLVDNTPPDPVVPVVAGGTSWRRSNDFLVRWTDPVTTAAPISRVHWKLCVPEGACVGRGQAPVTESRELRLSTPGAGEYLLHLWLEDAAGNQREATAAVAVPLRFDPEPPYLAFEPVDSNDPLRVAVNAADRLSGVASGQIEMRSEGTATWHALPTNLENGRLAAHVDDQRFRQGMYLFRAFAVDHAGNEASTGNRADGSNAAIRLPARVDTRLKAGLLRTVIRRKIVRRGGKRYSVRVRQTRLDSRFTARYGRRLWLTGRLTNSDGHPVAGATIEALERQPDGSALPIGSVTTGELGGFRYAVSATRNRDLTFRYSGSKRIGVASATVVVLVRAASSMRASQARVRNGEEVVFSGRVRTSPIPAAGKLLELQAYFRGRWRTFSTVRTTTSGRWRFPYRFGATVGRVSYRFRVVLPAEGGYPFLTGRSRVVEVVVTGQ